tara:strand:- start:7120 stop:7323 length:204 start_codon:yes stop_codon:yes gene_type:complete
MECQTSMGENGSPMRMLENREWRGSGVPLALPVLLWFPQTPKTALAKPVTHNPGEFMNSQKLPENLQ